MGVKLGSTISPTLLPLRVSKFKNDIFQVFVAEIKFLWYSHKIISVPQDKLIQI